MHGLELVNVLMSIHKHAEKYWVMSIFMRENKHIAYVYK